MAQGSGRNGDSSRSFVECRGGPARAECRSRSLGSRPDGEGWSSVAFAKEQVDISTPAGRFFRGMLAQVAEFEHGTILNRMADGRDGAALTGFRLRSS
ncbi:MAG: recombinase family protein [Actinobacteria bacterium]|nr:recombinase family protein [Actinomycetota bacterium]MBU1493517.1 recombinase family protein [Actinomycetota bacterium]